MCEFDRPSESAFEKRLGGCRVSYEEEQMRELTMKEIDRERRRAEFAWYRIHVRDGGGEGQKKKEEEEEEEDVPHIIALVESPERGKEFGVQRAFVEMITRGCHEKGYRSCRDNRLMTSISLCHSPIA